VSASLDIDSNSSELVYKSKIKAKPNSKLDTYTKALKTTQNAFAGLKSDKDVVRCFATLPCANHDLRSIYQDVIERFRKSFNDEVKSEAPKEVEIFFNNFLNSFQRTIDSKEMSFVSLVRSPNPKGFYTAFLAVSLKDANELETSFQNALKKCPAFIQDAIKLNIDKIGMNAIHEANLSFLDKSDEELFVKLFDRKNVYFTFLKNALVIATGPDAKAMIQESLNLKPSPAPAFLVESFPARIPGGIKRYLNEEALKSEFIESIDSIFKLKQLPILKIDETGTDDYEFSIRMGGMPVIGSFAAIYFLAAGTK
jgi:hypothetical protein